MKNTYYGLIISVHIINLDEVSRNPEACSSIFSVEQFKFKRTKCRSSLLLVIYQFIFPLKSSV